jgi:hypothetical protein
MPSPAIPRPDATEYSTAVANYVQLVVEADILSILAAQPAELVQLVGELNDEQSLVRHPPYTWTIKQVVGHMTDCERVFGYRAMRLARNDTTPLPGFDENAYMRFADFDRCPLSDLVAEFELLRRSHVIMLRSLEADAWLRAGVVNNHAMTVRAVAWVMAGHAQHHLNILHKRLQVER